MGVFPEKEIDFGFVENENKNANTVKITAVNCKGTRQRNISRYYFIPVMSYSRTYRRSNGVDMNQTNIKAESWRGTETGEGSHEETSKDMQKHRSKRGKITIESIILYPDCKQISSLHLPVHKSHWKN